MNTPPPTPKAPDIHCPSCGTANDPRATVCARCGVALPPPARAVPGGGRTIPIGGKTTIIPRGQLQGSGGKAHLVAPRDLDFGQLRHGEVARSKLRLANNGAGLLTGTARIGPDTPWLRILGTGSVYCAAGAVEALEVQVDTDGLRPGKHTGTVLLDTDGGQATVQVGVAVFRESMAPAILAAVVTALAVLAISGLVYANNGGRLPFVAVPTSTPLPTATPVPTATHVPTATTVPSVTAVPTTPRADRHGGGQPCHRHRRGEAGRATGGQRRRHRHGAGG